MVEVENLPERLCPSRIEVYGIKRKSQSDDAMLLSFSQECDKCRVGEISDDRKICIYLA